MSVASCPRLWTADAIQNKQVSYFKSDFNCLASNMNLRNEPAAGVTSEPIEEENFSYREISDLSDATQDNLPGEGSVAGELDDYERLLANTQKK